jgi:ubiquinone/menaquinone biosynthesis C-methylase UbiE
MTVWARTGGRLRVGSTAAASNGLLAARRAWNVLASADPLWAVCVDRERRAGSWDVGEFMASGQGEIAVAVRRLDQLGIGAARDSALDFGCGVGRLTGALSGYFGSVTGVDIAEEMLARARVMLADQPACRLIRNDKPDLGDFPDGSFDLVYSSLVLQHMPGRLAARYLREFVRVVRPGGAIVIVVPESHRLTPAGVVYAIAPQRLIGIVQRRLFGYPAAMQMRVLPARRVRRIVEAAGGRVVASDPEPCVGPHWRGYRHFVTRDQAPLPESG